VLINISDNSKDGLRLRIRLYGLKTASQNLPHYTNLDVVWASRGLAVKYESVELQVDDVVSGSDDRPGTVEVWLIEAVTVDVQT